MRLLTHNTLKNNSAAAKGQGFPLKITATEVRVDTDPTTSTTSDTDKIAFCQSLLANSTLDWSSLVTAANAVGIPTLPPTLTDDLAKDRDFLLALYQILMHVHVVTGTLTCPATGRQFAVTNEIPNLMLEEDECERVRY